MQKILNALSFCKSLIICIKLFQLQFMLTFLIHGRDTNWLHYSVWH